eukprot:TRINITY_DN1075_c0_g3_i4.p1 TRINITY_DN1075_c0_g3~~TRINITY_DN1075_c0_g3_i4.p1  ORF type:complete len:941 (-),score=122.47 TRINITY_DN1075_c0_g3_i4:1066-3888(-)
METNNGLNEVKSSPSKDVEMTSTAMAHTSGLEESLPKDLSRRLSSQKSFGGTFDKPSNFIVGGIEKAFTRFGTFVGTYPYFAIAFGLLFFAALMPGNTILEEESRGEKLWIPSGTESQKDKDYIDDRYPKFARFEEVLFVGCDGRDMLQPDVFDTMLDLHNKILNTTALYCPDKEKEVDSQEDCKDPIEYLIYDIPGNTADSRCFILGDDCHVTNILSIFEYNRTEWRTREAILDRINQNGAELSDDYLDGEPFQIDSILGGQKKEDNRIEEATAISLVYFLRNEEVLTDDNEYVDYKGEAWEEIFLDMMEVTSENQGECETGVEYEIMRFAGRSFSDEFGGSVDGDLSFLGVAIVVIIIYAILMMSRWQYGLVGMRLLSTLTSIVSIFLAYMAALGLMGYVGLFNSALVSVLPFLLAGIGVDDSFVLVNAYDHSNPDESVAERMGDTYSAAGASITITSLTNFFAFLIGSMTSLPGLRNFSIYAAVGILFIYIMQMTLFGGAFTIDGLRQKRNLREVCFTGYGTGCCPPNCQGNPVEKAQCPTPDQWLRYLMSWLGRTISPPWVKAVVICFYIALLAGGIVGLSQMEVDADTNDFVPPGSYLKHYIDAKDDYFTTVGESVGLYFKDIQYQRADVQEQMVDALNIFLDNRFTLVGEGNYSSWWEDFVVSEFYIETDSPSEFARQVELFTKEGVGLQYTTDIIFRGEGESFRIETSRFTGNFIDLDKSSDQVDSMTTLRDELELGLGDLIKENTFAYSAAFLQYEQYKQIGKEFITNVGLAMVMVLVIITIMLLNLFASTLTFVMILSIVLNTIGYMYFWNYTIDSVTVIFWVISLGLSVDYCVHITHGFLNQVGEGESRLDVGNSRMCGALGEAGVGIINGAISTFLAVLCLSGSESYVFNTFFSALFLVTVNGIIHGMLILPVFLSLLQPGPHAHLLQE